MARPMPRFPPVTSTDRPALLDSLTQVTVSGSRSSPNVRFPGAAPLRVDCVTAPIDPLFTALPLDALADAALARTRELGAEHADFRLERIRDQHLSLHDARLDGAADSEDLGFAVRVVHEGSWGFASGVDLTPDAVVRVAEQAVEVATVSRPLSTTRVELAEEPS